MSTIYALDPGPTQTAWVEYDPCTCEAGRIIGANLQPNEAVAEMLLRERADHAYPLKRLVVEGLACYGMPVGAQVFETAYWIGEYRRIWRPRPFALMLRMEVKMALCHDSRAKDTNIRQALIDIFGPPGTKKYPGATYGFKGDMWSALAVAWAWKKRGEQHELGREPVRAGQAREDRSAGL